MKTGTDKNFLIPVFVFFKYVYKREEGHQIESSFYLFDR